MNKDESESNVLVFERHLNTERSIILLDVKEMECQNI